MRRPNLILLTVECWRADHFGAATPQLARFGRASTVFESAYVPGGWTRISMTAIMSSAYASMYGGPEVALASPARRTLAECLLEKGYWTGGFTANSTCGSISGFHRGFGDFREFRRKRPLPEDAPRDVRTNWKSLMEIGVAPRDADVSVDARAVTDLALRWLDGRRDEPYFLWLHYLDPHWPCQMVHRPSNAEELAEAWFDFGAFYNHISPSRGTFDPGPAARSRWARRYRECVTWTDQEIGRLLDNLRLRSDWDRTIVAVGGDHGEEFFEHGTWQHGWNQLYEEGIHVPLILRVPGSQPRRIAEPVGLIDIAPTLLDFSGVGQPGSMIGRSLRPAVEGSRMPDRPVFSEMMGHPGGDTFRLAIRQGEWKYRYNIDAPHDSTLVNVSLDPTEVENLRERSPDLFRQFERLRLAHVTLGLTGRMERKPTERQLTWRDEAGDETIREQLEALGYL